MKIGGLREDILFKSKEYPLALPKKDSRGDFVFPPGTPLKRPKERPAGLSFGILSGVGRGIFGTKDVGTGTGDGGGVVAAIQGVLPCGGRSWGGLGSSGAGIGWLRPRGGRGRHAVPRAWPPPTKFRHEIWGVGQGRRALRVGRGKFPRSSGGSGARRSGQRRGERKKAPALAGAFLAQALAWARVVAAAGVSWGVSAVSGTFSWGVASRRSRATASISLMRFSWLTRVAPGS